MTRIFILVVSIFLSVITASADEPLKKAMQLFDAGKFEEALNVFEEAHKLGGGDKALMGKGLTYYRMEKFEDASRIFQQLAKDAESDYFREQALYNLGNSLTQQEKYKEAVSEYENALKLNSNDRDAAENLEYVKKLLKEQEKQNQEDKQDNQQQNSGGSSGQQNKDNGGQGEKKNEDKQHQSESKQQNNQDKKDQNHQGNSEKQDQSNSEEKKPQGDAKEQDGKSEQAKDGEKENEQDENSQQGENGKDKSNGSLGERSKERGKNLSDQMQTLLDSVEDDRGSLMEFRREKAIEELQRRKEKPPEKDW